MRQPARSPGAAGGHRSRGGRRATHGHARAGAAAEHTALRYAANWAAAGGDSDPGSRAELLRIYGERTAEAIDSALLAIRIGNLVGNSLEHWVCRVLPWRACADALRPAAGADEARS